MGHITNKLLIQGLCKKLTSPVSSLVNSEHEIKWVVLKNMQFIAQKYPEIFTDTKAFFIRYSEPSFIKHEKLKMILKLTDAKNWELVVNELNEYVYDIDTDFTEKAVHALWQVCMKISQSLDKVLTVLSNILKDLCGDDHGEHFLNEIAVALQQIMRRYPKSRDYLPYIKSIVKYEESITRPEGKLSLLFFCGEYNEAIEKSDEIINRYIENIINEELPVQLQILTSALKMYLHNQDKYQNSIVTLLQNTSENTDNADLRDRAFLYWRMLDEDINLAKEIILGEKPVIKFKEEMVFDKDLVNDLIHHIGFVNTCFHTHLENLPLTKVKQQIKLKSQEMMNQINIQIAEEDSKTEQGETKSKASPQKSNSNTKKVSQPKEDLLSGKIPDDSSGKKVEKKSLGKPPAKEDEPGKQNIADFDIFGDIDDAPIQSNKPSNDNKLIKATDDL